MATTKRKQRLIFDKVTFTLPIDENQRLTLIERINDPDFHAPYNRKVYPNKRGDIKIIINLQYTTATRLNSRCTPSTRITTFFVWNTILQN